MTAKTAAAIQARDGRTRAADVLEQVGGRSGRAGEHGGAGRGAVGAAATRHSSCRARRAGEESRLAPPLRVVDGGRRPGGRELGDRGRRRGRHAAGRAAGARRRGPQQLCAGPAPGRRRRAVAALRSCRTGVTSARSRGAVGRRPRCGQAGSPARDIDQTHDSGWSGRVPATTPSSSSGRCTSRLPRATRRRWSCCSTSRRRGSPRCRSRTGSCAPRRATGSVLLASVARFLPGALDGWDWYVDQLRAALDKPAGTDAVAGTVTAR